MRYYLVENIEYPLPFVCEREELAPDDFIIDGPFFDFISALDTLDDLWYEYEFSDQWEWW
jgi:hypothetical protein